jgi:ribosome-associated translation inhibitor RaiA
MKLPLQITFRQMEPSPALETRIRELAARLDKFSALIMRCHVIVEPLSHHQHKGALYDFRIDITVPDEEIAIRRAHPADHSHEDPYVALRDTFRAALHPPPPSQQLIAGSHARARPEFAAACGPQLIDPERSDGSSSGSSCGMISP